MGVTPSQQERYLELADAYGSFVQRARLHKAEALARIQKVGGHPSMPIDIGEGCEDVRVGQEVVGMGMRASARRRGLYFQALGGPGLPQRLGCSLMVAGSANRGGRVGIRQGWMHGCPGLLELVSRHPLPPCLQAMPPR